MSSLNTSMESAIPPVPDLPTSAKLPGEQPRLVSSSIVNVSAVNQTPLQHLSNLAGVHQAPILVEREETKPAQKKSAMKDTESESSDSESESDGPRAWGPMTVNVLNIPIVQIEHKTRLEPLQTQFPEKVYMPIIYQLRVRVRVPEDTSNLPETLVIKFFVVDSNNENRIISMSERRKVPGEDRDSIVAGDVEGELKRAAVDFDPLAPYAGMFKIKFTDSSYYYKEKTFRLRISCYLPDKSKEVCRVVSAPFRIFSRKPSKEAAEERAARKKRKRSASPSSKSMAKKKTKRRKTSQDKSKSAKKVESKTVPPNSLPNPVVNSDFRAKEKTKRVPPEIRVEHIPDVAAPSPLSSASSHSSSESHIPLKKRIRIGGSASGTDSPRVSSESEIVAKTKELVGILGRLEHPSRKEAQRDALKQIIQLDEGNAVIVVKELLHTHQDL